MIRLLIASLMLFGGSAEATTAVGTILTNVVCATMWDGPIGANAYQVSYCSSAYVNVVPPPRFEIQKKVSMDGVNWYKSVVAGSGSIVTFAICVYNGAAVAVDGVTLMDMLPDNTVLSSSANRVPQNFATGLNYYNGPGNPTLEFGWDTDNFGAAMNAGPPPVGQATDLYMRWTVEFVEANESACVTYEAEIL